VVSICLLALLPVQASDDAAGATLENDDQKVLYALGMMVSSNMGNFDFQPAEVELILAGLKDGLLRQEPRVEMEVYGPQIKSMMQSRASAATEREKAAGALFLAEAEQQEGVVKSASGLIYKEDVAGTGENPTASDTVRVHYVGTLRDGEMFDSSRAAGEPADFPLERVAPCFSEGIQKMKVGGKATLYCPPDLAYGDRGIPGRIPGGAVLVFEVELLEIVTEAEAPAAAGESTP
jgi:FKBP-type peptidyl-prolyl cis-trans isomerase FkpA